MKQEEQKKESLINWHEMSRLLSGKGQNIRPNKIPKKYKEKVDKLIYFIGLWIKWLKE